MEEVLTHLDALQKQYRHYGHNTKRQAKHHPKEVIESAIITRDTLCDAIGLYPAKAVQVALAEAPIWPPLSTDEHQRMEELVLARSKEGWTMETALEDNAMCEEARKLNEEKIAYEDLQSKLGAKFQDKKEEEEEEVVGEVGEMGEVSEEAGEEGGVEGVEGEEGEENEGEDEDEDEDEEADEDEDEEDKEGDLAGEEEEEEGDGTTTSNEETVVTKRIKKEKKPPVPREGRPNPSSIHPAFIGYRPRRPRDLIPKPPMNESVPPVPRHAMDVLAILNPALKPMENRDVKENTPVFFGYIPFPAERDVTHYELEKKQPFNPFRVRLICFYLPFLFLSQEFICY